METNNEDSTREQTIYDLTTTRQGSGEEEDNLHEMSETTWPLEVARLGAADLASACSF